MHNLCMTGITQHTMCNSRKLIFTLPPTRWSTLCSQLAYPWQLINWVWNTTRQCLRNHDATRQRQQGQITEGLRTKECLPWRLSTPILALLPVSPVSTSQLLPPSALTPAGPKWPQRCTASFPAVRRSASTALLRLLRIKCTKKYFQLSQGHNIQYLAVSRPFSDTG